MKKLKDFWKESSSLIGKMVINQIGILILAFIVCTATMNSDILFLCASIFSSLFYLVLLYIMTWEFGAKRHAGIEAGRLAPKPFFGVLISLTANSINLLIAVVACIAKLIAISGTTFSFFTTTPADIGLVPGAGTAHTVYATSQILGSFLQMMYMGITRYILPNCPLHLILSVLPSLLICGVGYHLGSKECKLSQLIFGKRTPKA